MARCVQSAAIMADLILRRLFFIALTGLGMVACAADPEVTTEGDELNESSGGLTNLSLIHI